MDPSHRDDADENDLSLQLTKTQTASSVVTNEQRRALTNIASELHTESLAAVITNEKALDPSHPQFDPYQWAKVTIRALDAEDIDARQQGILFEDLSVHGSGSSLHLQQTVLSTLMSPFKLATSAFRSKKSTRRTILHSHDGLLESRELLLVLGRPGSGCSTFLKTISGHLHGLDLDPQSNVQYKGIAFNQMIKEYRGEVLYNQEVDKHFPHLTVGETLEFAAHARAPHNRIGGMSRAEYVKTRVQVIMAFFGLSHTYNTKVGNDFIRGVSGGERKRVSIAEMALSRAPIGAWDNSTRGLDAAMALEFVQALRLSSDLVGSCHAVAAYQTSESMYQLFDQVVVLYEGRQIYYGPQQEAAQYFEEMGWERPLKQITPDFLTSITNPRERIARKDMADRVPRTPAEFEAYWKNSPQYQALKAKMHSYKARYAPGVQLEKRFGESKQAQQAKHVRPKSPYLLSIPMQIRICLRRAYQRTRNDLPTTLITVFVQIALSLIIGSIFYNTPAATAGFFQRGATLYFSVLMNALITINEIMSLYAQRPVVEKQAGYAFVHPFAEALASIILDFPIKLFRCICFSIILYFMANLRREPSQFFIYILFLITTVVTMSGVFRSLGSATKSIGQAMALAGICVICMVVYTGFTLPQPYMHPWFSWIRWINPIFYSFEGLVANEFHGRNFECSEFIPNYASLSGDSFICSAVGAVAGARTVSGDQFISLNYEYSYSHIWRNYGILIAFLVFFNALYLTITELSPGAKPTAEALVFRPGHVPANLQNDEETGVDSVQAVTEGAGESDLGAAEIPEQKEIFTWKNLSYDIPVKEGTRRLLDEVSGFVKPGTLTALMGVSGAGKTTLLDVLAQRASLGVITGELFVNGKDLNASFPRKVGYVQQQDMHLAQSTVREALRFSAVLRQPKTVSLQEKYAYVEEVIKMLDMEDFAEAVVGNPGNGLNVCQRKLLSIGVELAAKPELLIFLDEPTSGLDSQSAWAICTFMRKLAHHGQAVLATIHQPSALLFEHFDRLLFLAKGGKTVYFGDIGQQSQTLLNYFQSNGARRCEETENPAEYMLDIIGAGASGKSTIDWVQTWNNSPERKELHDELDRICQKGASLPSRDETIAEFAMPLSSQFYYVTQRVFQQYYRQPEYVLAKFVLGIVSGLFIGFSFWQSDNSQQGFQNVLFSLFLLCTIFTTLVNQIMPHFVANRALYEVRERPSKVYSWKIFIIAQFLAEIPWHIVLAVCAWASFYFAVFGADQSSDRMGLILLFVIQFYIFASSFAQFIISALPDPALGGMLAVFMFGLSLIFNGVMQPPSALPGFWIFMWRVSPLSYYIAGIAGTALHGRPIICSDSELSVFNPPSGQTCGEYLADYLTTATGRLYNENATESCEYCSLRSADQYLAGREISWDDRWRDYGIFWAYFVFNICAAIVFYYVFRVRPYNKKTKAKRA
ncbi:ABC multidrug transporter [Aspergillus neoniger CBS 115656]|uniref:ABC multidrug transporter n=1 Tax=Aspergillus neoniger (strain CBS 115656) TaxID=1448310 RepID=A0A318Y9E3_ASPNB|nr:ABC multidrug transporter [Aspergillus neoniger CBS 115656]PYH30935.1 ABC multidrug transporter [Aspergillus neoniger CBS 115656]